MVKERESWHLITFSLPPDISSLGYFALNTALLLQQAGYEVYLWTLHDKMMKLDKTLEGIQVYSLNEGVIRSQLPIKLRENKKSKLLLYYEPNSHRTLYKEIYTILRKTKGTTTSHLVLHKSLEKTYLLKKIFPLIPYLKERSLLKRIIQTVESILVTAPYLEEKVKKIARYKKNLNIHWLPLQSNIQYIQDKQRSQNIRKAFAPESQCVIGNFSSYKDRKQTNRLRHDIQLLLENHPERFFLCLGRGSLSFVEWFKKQHPQFENQIEATGELDYTAISAHIQACDIMIQIYYKGVTTKHTSLLTCLSHEKAILATKGVRTETFWMKQNCISLYQENSDLDFVKKFEQIVYDSSIKRNFELKAKETYSQYFSPNRTIKKILSL